MTVEFFVEGVPATKGSMKIVRGNGPKVRITPDSELTKRWATTMAWAARVALCGRSFGDAPVMVDLDFTLPRPKTVTAPWPTAKRDIDKLVRNVLDALTGIAWIDDGQVVRVTAAKNYPDDRHKRVGCAIRIVDLTEERVPHG